MARFQGLAGEHERSENPQPVAGYAGAGSVGCPWSGRSARCWLLPRLQSVFLAVQRIERDDGAGGDAEFGEQGLRCWNLVGFLGDVDMGKDEGGLGGERAQHLGGSAVVEIVKAAPQRLAIQRDAARPGGRACGLKPGGMATEDSLDRRRIEPLEDG